MPSSLIKHCIFTRKKNTLKLTKRNLTLGNTPYKATTFSKEEIADSHRSVLSSFGVSLKDDDCDLPTLYWTHKLHKCPYKQRFIVGSTRCTTKPLSQLLTSILTAIKTGLQRYCV